jgi:hypothetical protein
MSEAGKSQPSGRGAVITIAQKGPHKTTTPEQRADPILKRLPPGPATMVEIGVFVGTLSRYLLRKHHDLSMILVDNWAPMEIQPLAYRETKDRHAKQTLEECVEYRIRAKRNVREFKGRFRFLVMSSVEAAAYVADHSVDLVFIDADHSEEGARADIEAWQAKPKRGGYLAGHDFSPSFPGVERAVSDWVGRRSERILELDADHTWFCRC